MSSTTFSHSWQAEDYHHHSSVQKVAATQLLQYIQFTGHEKLLDVGCGDGKITAEIAKEMPNGIVIGMDTSAEMIDFACKSFPRNLYPNLTFSIQDAQQFDHNEGLDIIFSSFALQWLPDPSLFFKCAHASLKLEGILAATIPLGISSELESSINTTTLLSKWATYYESFSPGWHFISDENYKNLIIENNFIIKKFSLVLQEVFFHSRKDFENYVIPWFSYFHPLPQHLRRAFFNQVVDKYLELNPPFQDGKINFKFPRVDLIAEKVNL